MKYFSMALCVLFLFASCNQKTETPKETPNTKQAKKEEIKKEDKVAEWGNVTCPVMDDPVEEDGGSMLYEGKMVRFCCKKCVRKFKNNPKEYHDALVKYSKK